VLLGRGCHAERSTACFDQEKIFAPVHIIPAPTRIESGQSIAAGRLGQSCFQTLETTPTKSYQAAMVSLMVMSIQDIAPLDPHWIALMFALALEHVLLQRVLTWLTHGRIAGIPEASLQITHPDFLPHLSRMSRLPGTSATPFCVFVAAKESQPF
jgi:hypothetical protein